MYVQRKFIMYSTVFVMLMCVRAVLPRAQPPPAEQPAFESVPRQGHSLHLDEGAGRAQLVPCAMRHSASNVPYVFWFRGSIPLNTLPSSPQYALFFCFVSFYTRIYSTVYMSIKRNESILVLA